MFARVLPNLFTVGNLSLGIIAIILAFERQETYAALAVILGMLLDGLDGRVARMLNVQSEFGKALDSLADVIAFGVAPACIMYGGVLSHLGWLGIFITTLFPVCGALRLARFHVMTGTTNYFVGLPITAAGGLVATMALYNNLVPHPETVLPIAMVVLSYLMISNMKYANFKKVGIPRSALYVIPWILVAVIVLFKFFPREASRLVFLPLAFYALYGMRKSKKKRRLGGDHEDPLQMSWKQ